MFDDLSDIYDALIDWPKRLGNETPFYRQLFERVGARRVLDAACGSGRHAEMFHSWGMEVEGADLSAEMLAKARNRCGEPAGLRWVRRAFDAPVEGAKFDVAICVGNSLALAPDHDTLNRAVVAMLGALRPGGALVVQVLNIWPLPNGPAVWQMAKKLKLPNREVNVLKGVRRTGDEGHVELVLSDPETGQLLKSQSVPFLGLTSPQMTAAAELAGATAIHLFGGYRGQPYDAESSADLMMIATR